MQKDLKFHHTFLFSQNSIGILKEEENRIEFKKFNVPNENFA